MILDHDLYIGDITQHDGGGRNRLPYWLVLNNNIEKGLFFYCIVNAGSILSTVATCIAPQTTYVSTTHISEERLAFSIRKTMPE